MEALTLERTGNLPLAFEGEEVAGASSYRNDGPGNNRWHDLTLYRTRGGKYVLRVAYHSGWQGEDDHHFVTHAESPKAVRDSLVTYPVVPPGVGYPAGAAYAEKQARMETDLRRRFDVAVSDLFRGLDGGFTETIE